VGYSTAVILSEAKDLIAACHGHEILGFAQDDRKVTEHGADPSFEFGRYTP